MLHNDADSVGSDPQYHQPWTVIADSSGSFVTYWTVPLDGDAEWATLIASANGNSSGLHAEAIFTDAPQPACNLSAISGPASRCQGAGTSSYSVTYGDVSGFNWTVSGTGNTISFVNGSATVTWAAGFSGTATVTFSVTASLCTGPATRSLNVVVSPLTAAATANSGSGATASAITANWSASANATKYLLDVSQDAGFATFITAGGKTYNSFDVGNVTTYTVTGLNANTTYYYRVRASNSCGTAAVSNVITYGTLPQAPSAPTANAGTDAGCTQVSVSWNQVAGATGYFLDVARNNGFSTGAIVGNYKDSSLGAVSSFVITGLTAGNTYFYRLRAGNGGGFSGYSNIVSIATLPAMPATPGPISGLTTVCSGAKGVSYSTGSVAGATSYVWTVPTGASVATGDGQNAITVNFGNTAGSITVKATNVCGTSNARSLAISMNTAAVVSSEPLPQSVTYGNNASFTVAAGGTPAPNYQWQEYISSWNNVLDNNDYHGAATGTLSIDTPGVAASGRRYRCIVSNSCGADTTDETALLTVAARAITITADAKSKVYGEDDPPLTAQVTAGSIIGPDMPSGALARTGGKNAGRYAIKQGTYTYGANYVETYVEDSLTISPRPITITADPKNKTYGDSDPQFTAKVTSGNTIGTDAASGTLTRDAGENVGRYAIRQGTYSYGGNYAETFVKDSFSIGQRAITITANAAGKVYGDADSVLKAKVTSGSIVPGDAPSGTLVRATGEGVGAYVITRGSYSYGGNYSENFVEDSFRISKRPISINVNDGQHKTYGNADPASFAYTLGAGEHLASWDAFSGNLSRDAGEQVGNYPIRQAGLSIKEGSVDHTGNYAISFNGSDFAIERRAITITADAKSKTYGDPDPPLTARVTTGTIAGNDAPTGALNRAPGENVGRYVIRQGTYSYGSNYLETFVEDSFSIGPRAITLTANAAGKIYGDADSVLKAKVTSGSIVAGDGASGTLIRAAGEDVGAYVITKGTYTYGGNYAETFEQDSFRIRKRALNINVTAGQHKTYGNADPAFAYTLGAGQSLASWDAFSGGLSRDAGESAGTYPIGIGGLVIKEGSVDHTGNYAIVFAGSNFVIDKRPVCITADAKAKSYGAPDPVLTYQITNGSLAFNDTFSGSLERVAGENVDNYAILQGSVALNSNYTLTYRGATFRINAASITTYFGVPVPARRQYSDTVTFRARIIGGAPKFANTAGAADSVIFKVGTQVMGTVVFSIDGADLVAALPTSLLETVAGQMAPGTKTITAVFKTPNGNYGLTTANNTLSDPYFTIDKEDARIEYTGDQLMSTGTTTTAIVKLRAQVLDITAVPADPAYDKAAGDIRNAKVMFVNGESRTPLSGWLPVVLIAGDSRIGTVAFNDTVVLSSAETDREISIGIVVDYGYYRRDCTADNTVVTVYKPVGDFITGGGHVVPDKSVGTMKSDIGTKTNFGFNVKYTKKGTSLQGNMNIVFRRTENDGVLHTYQIKANSLQSLAVNASNPALQTAQFSSKANLTDVTNPLAPVARGGNKTLYVYMTDRGDPGSQDSISIVLVEGTANPAVLANLIYSSEWLLNKSGQKGLRGGNLVVKSGFSLGATTPTAAKSIAVAVEETFARKVPVGDACGATARFGLRAYPVPTQSEFTLVVESDDARTPVTLRITDLRGRVVQQYTSLSAGQVIRTGVSYAGGTYLAEMIQGRRRTVVRLLKE
ncbi:MBG domain-containing protein [Flaviaesturariibacter flavus]|uniref:MBG domain-containing protein n=1 Tax=Flaviaesturariibacter flavus TaxID=2502780 RepID=UPI001404BD7D|nr:MBG domain-containing protein [Flaviaesturariibacter flavus]